MRTFVPEDTPVSGGVDTNPFVFGVLVQTVSPSLPTMIASLPDGKVDVGEFEQPATASIAKQAKLTTRFMGSPLWLILPKN